METTNVKAYKATIVGLEEAQSFGNVLYLSLSNIEEKGEDNKFTSVNGFPQINKDGELTMVKSFSKGYKCLLEMISTVLWGKLLQARTMGRPYLYDGANTVMSLILSGATIKFERYLLKEGEDNPNIPGSKLPRDMYFTNIKSITLDMASIKELSGFIKSEINSLKKKEVEQVELTAIPED